MFFKISKYIQEKISNLNLIFIIVFIWGLAFIVPYIDVAAQLSLIFILWLLVIFLLKKKKYGAMLAKMALVFIFFWTFLNTIFAFYNPEIKKIIYPIIIWVALGLNLLLIASPLSLALMFNNLFKQILGKKTVYIAISLALLARQLPTLINLAVNLKKNINLRMPQASFYTKFLIFSRRLISLSLMETDLLAKSILKRWPYL